MSSIPARPRFKKRKKNPQFTFKSKFESAILKITAHFFETESFKHSLTKGEEREVPIRQFLLQNLPKTFSIAKGEIVDLRNSSSPQLDIMIYDNSRNIPFVDGESQILPSEALLASVEVKTRLTQEDIRKIVINAAKLKSLKPFGKDVDKSRHKRRIEEKVDCRFFHTVFAYSTDLSEKDWLKCEFERINRVAAEERVDPKLIDRIFILNRGFINLADNAGIESKNNAEIFLYYYMHLLNFLQRENARRKTVPYLEYAGKMSNGWKKLFLKPKILY